MSVFALGLNHTTAPVDLRGRFAFSADQLVPTLRTFRERLERPGEVAIVSSCNRTEIYVGASPALLTPAVDWLAGLGGVSSQTLRQHSYVFEGSAAARHAFRVASGLDSMVLGEPLILGLMKQAVREADTAGTLGTTLHQMFQRSFAVAKEVRTSTEIGAHSISMAAAAVRLAAEFGAQLLARAAATGAGGIADLRHEAADHAMENGAVVEALAGQFLDALDMIGGQIGTHRDHHAAAAQFHDQRVFRIGGLRQSRARHRKCRQRRE